MWVRRLISIIMINKMHVVKPKLSENMGWIIEKNSYKGLITLDPNIIFIIAESDRLEIKILSISRDSWETGTRNVTRDSKINFYSSLAQFKINSAPMLLPKKNANLCWIAWISKIFII